MINRLIAGRYQILSELGSGAMGTVYLANDSQTGAQVAIKQLINTHTEDYLVERFKREGEALRDLNHPNIVKMLDALEDNGEHFLVMEYVPAGTLKMRIEDRGAIAPLDAINMALDLADALTRAHRIGIVHRDIKPANVLIAEDETLRLTDFGVARVNNKSHMTETDGIVGTIAYLPPEALQEGHYDVRSDVWAFGILLYEMLTATHPFASNSLAQTVMNITREPVPDLEQYIPDAPLALIDLIYRMLEKDAQVRMPSVRIVGAELEAILENRTVVPIMLNETFEQTQTFEPAQHNLPVQTTPFVGRDLELGQLTRLFNQADTRLVTILAPGGMGKTRLALEIAFNRIEQYVDGVHFVDLAPLNDAERIVDAIAEAVDFSLGQTDLSAQEQLAHFLSRREMLLVLDNYEHLLDGAELVTDLLQSAPQLSLLVTSRQRLNQSGEKVFPLTGFEVSDWQSADDALESPAGQLFLQGAGRVQPNFELTDKNLDAVQKICEQVEGLPLGILLAASWLGVLSPQEISEEIATGIEFLETDMSDVPQRQRSIRAIFDYSWQLLSADEQATFMKLSVFRGGFTREAAQAVTDASLRMLMRLVNKSLLRRDASSGRYSIHELLRQYAAAQLDTSGEEYAVREKHSQYYGAWMTDVENDIKYARSVDIMNQIDPDFDNIQTGFFFAAEHILAVLNDYSETLFQYFNRRNLWFLGESTFETAMEKYTDKASLTYTRMLLRYATLTNWQSFTGAATPQRDRIHHQVHAVDETALPPYEKARYFMALSDFTLLTEDKAQYVAYANTAVEIAQDIKDELYLLLQGMFFLQYAGEYDGDEEARATFNDLVAEANDAMFTISSAMNNGIFASDLTICETEFRRGLHYALLTKNAWGIIVGHLNVGNALYYRQQFEDGKQHIQQAFTYIDDYRMSAFITGAVELSLMYALAEDDLSSVHHLLNENMHQLWVTHWYYYAQAETLPPIEACYQDKRNRFDRFQTYPQAYISQLWAVEMALTFAMHETRAGNHTTATELTSLALSQSIVPDWCREQHPVIQKLRADLRETLSEDDHAGAWARGKQLDLSTVLENRYAPYI